MKRTIRTAWLATTLAAGLALVGSSALAEAADIGFARAEQIALSQVPGAVKEIERDRKFGKDVFKVDVRTSQGASFDVIIDARDGSVLKVTQDD